MRIYILLFSLSVARIVSAQSIDCYDDLPLKLQLSSIQADIMETPISEEVTDSHGLIWRQDRSERTYSNLYRSCIRPLLAKVDETTDNQALHQLSLLLFDIGYMSTTDTSEDINELIPNFDDANKPQIRTLARQIQSKHWSAFDSSDQRVNVLASALVNSTKNTPVINLSDLRVEADLLPRNGVVVISSPFCNPSRRFYRWLASVETTEVEELQWFRANGLILFQQNGHFELDYLHQWSRELPMPSYLIRSELDWPQIPYWGTPTFYFINDGQVVEQIVGWPSEGRVNELLSAIQRVIPES